MSLNLIFYSAIFSLFIIIFIFYLLIKNKINIKYSLIWFVIFSILLFALIIPGFMESLTKNFGFQTPSNMVLSLLIAALIVINVVLTMIVSGQDKKIRLLVQEISMLNDKVRKLK